MNSGILAKFFFLRVYGPRRINVGFSITLRIFNRRLVTFGSPYNLPNDLLVKKFDFFFFNVSVGGLSKEILSAQCLAMARRAVFLRIIFEKVTQLTSLFFILQVCN